MDQPPATRRRFRFGLRTLLAVVTLAAVGSWGYFVAWPWWLDNRERIRFESAIRQMKIGPGQNGACQELPVRGGDVIESILGPTISHAEGKFIRTQANYCIVFTWKTPAFGIPIKIESITAYRVNRAPSSYRSFREHELITGYKLTREQQLDFDYIGDFADFILGDPEDGRQFQYKLIYSDPPAKK